jgi:hypothetical protein
MDSRLDLDDALVTVLNLTEPDGDRHTYFNPPPSVQMRYPAIKYSLNRFDRRFANNGAYKTTPSYSVILIDEDPDSKYVEKILQIPYCSFDRFYVSENLNHWVFTIYNH